VDDRWGHRRVDRGRDRERHREPPGVPRQRRTDRQIGRLGDYTGQSFVIIGAVAAMMMAMAGWDRFWIANVIYLCFVLSAILGSITKTIAYRRSVPQW
jgi:hypothetical protein